MRRISRILAFPSVFLGSRRKQPCPPPENPCETESSCP
jgi:hypothetical protein